MLAPLRLSQPTVQVGWFKEQCDGTNFLFIGSTSFEPTYCYINNSFVYSSRKYKRMLEFIRMQG